MSKIPGPKHLLPSRRHCSFASRVPTGGTVSIGPAIRMPGLPCLGCGKRARTQPAKPWRPAMRSMVAMIAISRAARSSMRSTALASQVGLSHSTQLLSPCNMASESKGRLAGFIGVLSVFDGVFLAAVLYENKRRRICKAKTRRRMMSLPGKLRLAGAHHCRTWPVVGTVSILSLSSAWIGLAGPRELDIDPLDSKGKWELGFLLTRFWVGPGVGRGDGSRGGARARQLTFLTFLMSEASRSRVSLASCEICLSVGITGLFSNAVPSPNFTSTDVRKLFFSAIAVSESNNTYQPVTGKPTAQFLMVAPPIFALIGLISTTVTTGTKSLCLPSLWRR